ncbi:MAG: divalent-cation tolerance protein CutA [Candidatus Levybacteria bacterium]|nr:divalent-cation tolerance protein CutA [Candidatus Levybacteria bacterium]
MKMIIVYLTCANEEEALRISEALLDKKLVACAKKLPINSSFWWEGKKDTASEILVLLETVEDKFEAIEAEVKVHHSYETPMLFAVSVLRTTEKVKKWLREELN